MCHKYCIRHYSFCVMLDVQSLWINGVRRTTTQNQKHDLWELAVSSVINTVLGYSFGVIVAHVAYKR